MLCGEREVSIVLAWRRENIRTEDQGVVILGTPLGHADFVRRHLQSKLASHRTLLEQIPSIPDLQSAWLILLFCASTRRTSC